jgi:hypothetical protein
MKILKRLQNQSYYWVDRDGKFNYLHVYDDYSYWGVEDTRKRVNLRIITRHARKNNRAHVSLTQTFHTVRDITKRGDLLAILLQCKVR